MEKTAKALRKVAAKLREEADQRDTAHTVKCAQVIRGAVTLHQLKKKLGVA